jgi:hypothetical protein
VTHLHLDWLFGSLAVVALVLLVVGLYLQFRPPRFRPSRTRYHNRVSEQDLTTTVQRRLVELQGLTTEQLAAVPERAELAQAGERISLRVRQRRLADGRVRVSVHARDAKVRFRGAQARGEAVFTPAGGNSLTPSAASGATVPQPPPIESSGLTLSSTR